jgi:hypothetical protein
MAVVSAGGSVFYDVVDFGDAGADVVQLRVQARQATNVALHIDDPDGPSIGDCAIAATGDAWATESCTLAHTSGVHNLVLLFGGATNLNWLQFSRGG